MAVELGHELGLGVDQPEPRHVDGSELEDPGMGVVEIVVTQSIVDTSQLFDPSQVTRNSRADSGVNL